jgi:cytoskeletal protein RodZ
MIKLLSSASVIALLAMAPAVAQTTTTPPAATQDKSQTTTPSQSTTPSTTQDKSTTPSMTQDKSTTPSTAQDKSATPSTQAGTQPATQDQTAVTMTEDQAKGWVDKAVYSSDGKEVGEVVEFKRGSDSKVSELHADLGGFLGMGETRVKLMPSEFKLQGDRVVLNITEEQAKALPKVEK